MTSFTILRGIKDMGWDNEDIIIKIIKELRTGTLPERYIYARGIARLLFGQPINVLNEILADCCGIKPTIFGRWRRGETDSPKVGYHFYIRIYYLLKLSLEKAKGKGKCNTVLNTYISILEDIEPEPIRPSVIVTSLDKSTSCWNLFCVNSYEEQIGSGDDTSDTDEDGEIDSLEIAEKVRQYHLNHKVGLIHFGTIA